MLCSLIMHSVSLCNAQLSVHYAVIMHSWEMIEDIDNAQ